jgi:hypothetical protein
MPGQIIIHDRNRVQSEILPFYFNHASFASFRRNLSYFSFVRLGRGRHSGAITYINDAVFELADILRLKRRAVGSPPGGLVANKSTTKAVKENPKENKRGRGNISNDNLPRPLTQQEPKDVASAVISGRMHACETNHESDKKFNYTTTVGASKSIGAVTLGTKSRGGVTASTKSNKKKRSSSKYGRSSRRKGRNIKGGPRVDRLLYANGIVPFIHLPMRLFKANYLQEDDSRDSSMTNRAHKGSSSSEASEMRRGGHKKARFDSSGGESVEWQ